MPAEHELSLRDELSAAFDEHTQETPETQPAQAEPPAAATSESVPAERPRDEQGRFAKKEEVAPAEQPAGADQPQPASTEKPTEQPVATPADEVKPPQAWKSEHHAIFKALPKEAQAIINAREAEAAKRITANDDERTYGKTMRETLAPYRAMIQSTGMQEQAAVQELFNIYYSLRTVPAAQKAAILYDLGQRVGADFVALANSRKTGAPLVNPEIASLQGTVNQVLMRQQQWEQQQTQAQAEYVRSHIDTFAADPAHPHFQQPEIRDLMSGYLDSGRATTMQQAYDMAIWAHPSTRSTLIAQQGANTQQVTDLRNKANAKQRAAGSVKGAPGGAPNAAVGKERSLREELSAQFDAVTGR